MVKEENIANHAGYVNEKSIGIEHVNTYSHNKRGKRLKPTREQYNASARLVAHLCLKYDIPVIHCTSCNEKGIAGHTEIDGKTKHGECVDPAWDWDTYIKKVQHMAMLIKLCGYEGSLQCIGSPK